jgi:tetratricopeptide (TPR) repeat protein
MASAPTATVNVGVQPEYTRLAFRFAGPTTVTPTMQGNRLELRFSRAADLDVAELRSAPPRFVREVRRLSSAGAQVRVGLVLDPGVRYRNFVDGDRVIIDLLPPEESAQSTAVGADGRPAPAPARPPVTGTATVQLVEEAAVTRITVNWPAPARAAAFRRGEALWLLFDAAGQINLSGVTRAGRRHQDIEVVRGDGVIGLRIPASPDVMVSAEARDNAWTFTLGPRAQTGEGAQVTREANTEGRGRLIAAFGREGVVRWINDPEIGDRIAVALVGGPAKGVSVRRATMEAALLPAAHGAVIEPRADDLNIAFADGRLNITRGVGLISTAAAPPAPPGAANSAALEAALSIGGDVEAAPTADGETMLEIRRRIDDLTRRAADEGTREGAPVTARMALARYLLRNELAPEALGALRIVAVNQGELVELDPEFRMLRGAANVMMERIPEALNDLNSSALRSDPSAALWRGYAAATQHDWAEARRELERGMGALEQHPPGWRARFQLALANAALELNDLAAAETAARGAMGQASDQSLRLHARLIEARILAARDDNERALTMFDELGRTRDEEVAVRASLEALRIRRASGVMRAIDSVEPLEALRYRWRGDEIEMSIVAVLGETYSELGRWREALGTMRVVADRYPSETAARRLRQEMATLFERLFLDGEADQLEPIQALGLFYEFSDLTPVGPNGDRIVRLLSGRLVHVDLLEQAAQLLQHQVDERLEGMGRAQVAADLAAIYLMDNAPDRALIAINSTRQPNLPTLLLAERRIIEARALLGLGRLDHAVELVERDRGEDAQRVRAEAAWRARDWERAAVELRGLLAMRNRGTPLDAGDRQAVLRAGIALTLANNNDGVRALYRDYAGDMAGTDEADSFEVVASGVHAEGAAIRDVARIVARTDLLDRFMTRIRARMTAEAAAADQAQGGPATPATPPAPAPQTPAPAAAAPPTTPARPTAQAGT